MDSPELLIRRPGEKISEVTRAWQGEIVACIACGPSLTREQLELVRASGAKTAVVNDAYLVAPWAELLYACDGKWWQWHSAGLAKTWPWARYTKDEVKRALAAFAGQKATLQHPSNTGTDPAVHRLKNDSETTDKPDGLAARPDSLRTGRNSGYQLINLVAHSRPRRIVLVGYDMKHDGRRSHAHDGHPAGSNNDVYREFVPYFAGLPAALAAIGVEIVNSTLDTAIKSLPSLPLREALR